MSHWLLLLLLGLAGAASTLMAWRLARADDWLLAWLRGCTVIVLVLASLVAMLLAYDVARFSVVNENAQLAELAVTATGPTTFLVEFTDKDGDIWYTSLSGDAWQLHIRGLTFSGFASVLTSAPLAKIHAVSNRYYDFANSHQARTVVVAPSFLDSIYAALKFDAWSTLKHVFNVLGFLGIEHQEQDSAVVPLVDGAVYIAAWQRTYVDIEPGNEIARISLQGDGPALLRSREAEE